MHAPENVIAWTLRGIYYNSINNSIESRRCFLEADKFKTSRDQNKFLQVIHFLLNLNSPALTDTVLSFYKRDCSSDEPSDYFIARAALMIADEDQDFAEIIEVLEAAKRKDYNNPEIWILYGNAYYNQGSL
eukprot:UC4_evm1s713